MFTIHNLEVRLDVEGQGDEAVFVKLFDKYIRKWNRAAEEAKARQRLADEHRSLGDRPAGSGHVRHRSPREHVRVRCAALRLSSLLRAWLRVKPRGSVPGPANSAGPRQKALGCTLKSGQRPLRREFSPVKGSESGTLNNSEAPQTKDIVLLVPLV